MKNQENSSSAPEFPTLPYIYGRQTACDAISEEKRIALFPAGTVPEPQLEELKANDPDSYRMVVYSWG